MDVAAPYEVVLRRADALTILALSRTIRPLTGREVARISGEAQSTVARSLKRLEEHGLVKVQEAGAGVALLFTLNREHLAVGPILDLLNIRKRFIEQLTAEITSWAIAPEHVSLFGSTARQDGDTSSDIDILIVQPKGQNSEDAVWRAQVDDLSSKVRAWTGNHAGIAEISVAEALHLDYARPPIVNDLQRDGITVFGPPIQRLFEQQLDAE